MISVNTNIAFMSQQNLTRLNLLAFGKSAERLETGYKVNKGADDPSGIAMTGSMDAQVRGINTAIQNIQDDINLVHTADAALDEIQSAVLRMRDLSLKLANRATLNANPKGDGSFPPNPSDSRLIKDEMQKIAEGIQQLATMTSYNSKGATDPTNNVNPLGLLFGTFAPGQQVSQIGPDNSVNMNVGVVIPSLASLVSAMDPSANPLDPPPNANDNVWHDFAVSILANIDETDTNVPAAAQFGLPTLSNARAQLGVLENNLNHTLNDLQAQQMGVSGERSGILDADLAQEATTLSTNMIKMQSAQAVAAQAVNMPKNLTKLIDVLYGGMLQGPFAQKA